MDHLLKNEVSKRLRGYRPDRRIGANGPEGAAVIIKEVVHDRLLTADGLEGGCEFRARQQGKAARTWECSYDEPMIIWEVRGAMIKLDLGFIAAIGVVETIQSEQDANVRITPWQFSHTFLEALEVCSFCH